MDEARPARRPTTLVLAVVGLFLLAVLFGRLLLAGGTAWLALVVVVPLLVFALTAAVGFRFALAAALAFLLAVLGVRWLLERNPLGWIGLALLPVVAFTGMLVGRVLGQLRRPGPPA